ncbi:hypothetical protein OR1_02822 [Geobacter sp. OR-1]|uniref:hypothetical protein n=1 Tax=Geobacter sp. OR-1 TaxID=1266765 RepID=UPI00054215CD|nr:hypothetical protein [Geobacter sp. OR-1]GAM10533.1 hypothetical protein OR1_02822 [Geobacter sp. OR-1]
MTDSTSKNANGTGTVSGLPGKKVLLSVVAVISLLAGIFTFSAIEYKSPVLRLDAKSLETGRWTVQAEADGSSRKYTKTLEITDNSGNERQYLVELPAIKTKSITIIPVGRYGSYEIGTISLYNDTVSYSWYSQGGCSKKIWSPVIRKSEPCPEGRPGIALNSDGSISITAIPQLGFANSNEFRSVVAVIIALGLFFGLAWVFSPTPNHRSRQDLVDHYLARVAWLVVWALYLYRFYQIREYGVDVPFQDEWTYFDPEALPNGFSWKWLFSFHNDHRQVLTNFTAWLNLKLFGFDVVYSIFLNNLFFGCLLLAVKKLKEIVVGKENFLLFPAFMVFLLSPIAFETQLWGMASTIHLQLLFSVAALIYAYKEEPTIRDGLIFSLLAVLGVYNFSGGVIFAAVYLVLTSGFVLSGIARNRIASRAGIGFIATNWIIAGSGIALWFYGYRKPMWSQPWLSPFDARFWDYFLNVVAFGFGIDDMGLLPGLACVFLTVMPIVLLLKDKESRNRNSTWIVVTAILGIFAVLAAISMGRTVLTPPKTSRYAEFGFLLIPYAALAWWLAIRQARQAAVILAFLWCFCFAAYWDNWATDMYLVCRQESIEILECVEDFYRGSGDGACQEPNPVLKSARIRQLELARKLGVKFTTRFE